MYKHIYFFGSGVAEGKADMENLLGGKGANLAEMTRLGVPVPAGFTITTEVCTAYYANHQQWPGGLEEQIDENLCKVEQAMGSKFGDPANPLLLSVRSGARVSMPGMMDTILNLGLNDATVEGLIKRSGNARFAYDSYRRFIEMYGNIVLGLGHDAFKHIKEKRGVQYDTELSAEDCKGLASAYKAYIKEATGNGFPLDPKEQLRGAINAVFSSWNNPRAKRYRKMNDIPSEWGTAVTVQSMVFGNLGDTSGTGIAFTRNPSTGDNAYYGEYLANAQGEDVVGGIRTPQPLSTLEQQMPAVYKQLTVIFEKLERHYHDMQDLEFTIQDGTLYLLQTRTGKRTAQAAVRIAVEMVSAGLIDEKTAVMRVQPESLEQLLHPTLDPEAEMEPLAKGLPASPGAAIGRAVFHADDAEVWAAKGEKVILVRTETSPEDIGGMDAAQGILTSRGGMTSHAAVIARGMGKCCVAGASDIKVDEAKKQFSVGGTTVQEGDWLTLDGSTGIVVPGQVKLIEPQLSGDFAKLMAWADRFRVLKVRANADTPHDAAVARGFGAEGIGLCRTEHMFFAEGRIGAVREMILAADEQGRRKALARLLPMQRGDFYGIFKVMKGLPVIIRLLDPPLHEFLPHEPEAVREAAKDLGVSEEEVRNKVQSLSEFNPMLGHRGVRLGITYPEIYEMQARAIFEAASRLKQEGFDVTPEVMIPLVGALKELTLMKEAIVGQAEAVAEETGVHLEYLIGTMIEVPRAVLIADDLAAEAEFFSFGTNDLTQMTFGYSRDDAGSFLPSYIDQGILEKDPFQSLDQGGVGELVQLGVERGRARRSDLKVGICGEHGGDPSSVAFFHASDLNYVSCSPYRVPIARLAAAQANINAPR